MFLTELILKRLYIYVLGIMGIYFIYERWANDFNPYIKKPTKYVLKSSLMQLIYKDRYARKYRRIQFPNIRANVSQYVETVLRQEQAILHKIKYLQKNQQSKADLSYISITVEQTVSCFRMMTAYLRYKGKIICNLIRKYMENRRIEEQYSAPFLLHAWITDEISQRYENIDFAELSFAILKYETELTKYKQEFDDVLLPFYKSMISSFSANISKSNKLS